LYANALHAQDQDKVKAMEIYGFIMMDAGHNFRQIDPNWFDVVRPTKLPAFPDEFGTDGNTYFSVRQTRFGVKNWFNTSMGDVMTQFEFEMFGTGVDAGQTTLRLRHAYAEMGHWGFGQYWSPFMDIDVFPNTVEYWGPPGMAFFRNVQIRYMPIKGDTRATIALERPGAAGDQGVYADRIELSQIAPRFPYPDLSAEYRYGGQKWGYVELAGIARAIQWRDLHSDTFDFSGHAFGWGFNLSTNIKFGSGGKTVFRGAAVYGEGIENYMNDAPVDIGIQNDFGNKRAPIKGVALPVLGTTAFIDHNWSSKASTSLGYSSVWIDNSNAQLPSDYHFGQYGIVNLLWYPVEGGMIGIEGQWGYRQNYRDGWSTEIYKVQVSARYNFSYALYKPKS
jgi:hypothetical protein